MILYLCLFDQKDWKVKEVEGSQNPDKVEWIWMDNLVLPVMGGLMMVDAWVHDGACV